MKNYKILGILAIFLISLASVSAIGSTNIDAKQNFIQIDSVTVSNDVWTDARFRYDVGFTNINGRIKADRNSRILVSGRDENLNRARVEFKNFRVVSKLGTSKVVNTIKKEGITYLEVIEEGSQETFENEVTKENADVYVEAKVILYTREAGRQIYKDIFRLTSDGENLEVYSKEGIKILSL